MTETKPTDPNGWVLNPNYDVWLDPLPARVRVVFDAVSDSLHLPRWVLV